MSMDTIMEDSHTSISNTDAIIYGASNTSGRTESLISDPNIPNSSSSSEDEHYQKQISTAAGGSGDNDDDLMIIVSSSESSNSTNNNEQGEPKIRIFNVDFMGSRSRPYECSICGLEFPTGQALGGHMRRHRVIITSEDECQQQSSTPRGGGGHMRRHRVIITSEDECQQQSSTPRGGGDDNNSMMIVSSGEFSRSTNNNKQGEQKIRIFNVDIMEYSCSQPHECSICGLEFPTGQALGEHMRRHRAIITSEDEFQQQSSTPGGGSDDYNSMIILSSGESSRSKNNNKQSKQKVRRTLNVDFMGSRIQPHECSICGLEFLTGQALGGHMGRHRAIIMRENLQVDLPLSLKRSNGPRVLCLDLNLTPLENDLEFKLGIESTPIVNLFF